MLGSLGKACICNGEQIQNDVPSKRKEEGPTY